MSDEKDPHADSPEVPLEGVISRAVDLGYKVIEDQIQLGQRMAERVSDGNIDSSDVTSSMSEIVERLRVFYSDLGALWFEMLESVFRNPSMGDWLANATGEFRPRTSNSATNGAAQHNAQLQLPVEIISPEPTGARVMQEFHGEPELGSMIVAPLQSRDTKIPALAEISFIEATEGWPATLRVVIPAGQPPGTYSGLVLNSFTDEPAGTLCVQIPDKKNGS